MERGLSPRSELRQCLSYSNSLPLVRATEETSFPFAAVKTEARNCICSPTNGIKETTLSLSKWFVQSLSEQSLTSLNFLN